MTQQPAKGFGRRGKKPGGDSGREAKERLCAPRDKREIERSPSFRNSHIILKDNTALECIARDISTSGCRVSLAGAENLPEELTICLGPGSPPRPAKVVWREFDSAGLQFLTPD